MSAVFAYVHTLSMIALASMMFAMLLNFDSLKQQQGLRRFWQFSCGVTGAAALALASGIALLFSTDAGAAFYLYNPVFYIKLALFAAMLLIAITPARIIIRWQEQADVGVLPDAVTAHLVHRYLTFELCLLLVIPLAASLAARGIGTQLGAS